MRKYLTIPINAYQELKRKGSNFSGYPQGLTIPINAYQELKQREKIEFKKIMTLTIPINAYQELKQAKGDRTVQKWRDGSKFLLMPIRN